MPPMVVKVCYDGDRFGEVHYFEKNVQTFAGYDIQEKIETYHKEKGIFGNFEQKFTSKMIEDLTEKEIKMLNK